MPAARVTIPVLPVRILLVGVLLRLVLAVGVLAVLVLRLLVGVLVGRMPVLAVGFQGAAVALAVRVVTDYHIFAVSSLVVVIAVLDRDVVVPPAVAALEVESLVALGGGETRAKDEAKGGEEYVFLGLYHGIYGLVFVR